MKNNQLTALALTDTGKVRKNNEDSILFYSHPTRRFSYVAIADGMGGYIGGAMASNIAISEIEKELSHLSSVDFLSLPKNQQEDKACQSVRKALVAANNEILIAKTANPECIHMGTTVVVAVLLDHYMIVAHVGDSRAYLWSQDGHLQLTKDHSVVQEMIDSGILNENSARESPLRNRITRAIGINEQLDIEMNAYILNSPALIMLCSDGVTEYLTNQDIERYLASNSDIYQTCTNIISQANLSGGKDNISVGIICFTPSMEDTDRDITIRRR